jgi:hypothetical protein
VSANIAWSFGHGAWKESINITSVYWTLKFSPMLDFSETIGLKLLSASTTTPNYPYYGNSVKK